jgi:hypothetical protein
MPLLGSFGAACARGLGLGNGEAPLAPTITTPASNDTTLGTAITAAIVYTITISTFPLARVEYKLNKINSSNVDTDVGQWTGSLPGASGSNSATLSTRVNSSGATEDILHAQKYALYLRAVDGAGQTGPESAVRRFTTAVEVAPTAATPVISSSQVSYPTTPFLSFTWGAGTAGTYSIGTRQYSVVAGNNPGAGTYTTMSGTSGTPVTIRSTSNGTAIRAGTQYTVYFKYTSTSPTLPAGFGTAYAVHTTASEIAPTAPNSANLRRNTSTLTTERTQVILSPGTITNSPTYNYKFQYALSTSNPPTNWANWPNGNSSTAITVSASPATTYYLRFQSVSILPDGTEVTTSAATGVASVTTRANVPPAPTLAWSGMSGSSYANPTFALTSNGGSTSSMRISEPGLGVLPGASGLSTGIHTITMNYTSNGASKAYFAQAVNVDGDSSSNSSTIYWTLPTKNVEYVVKPQGTTEYQLAATNSALDGCSPSYFGITHSSTPNSDDIPGYKRVDYYGFQIKSGGICSDGNAFSNTSATYLYWTDPAGTKTASLSDNTNASYSVRYEYLGLGGSSLNGEIKINFLWSSGGEIGSAARRYSGFCVANGCSYFFAKEFYVQGVQTINGAISP